MYIYKLCGSYPRNYIHTKDFQKLPKMVYLPVFKFSNRMITSELNNAQSIGVVNMSTPLNGLMALLRCRE